MAYLRCTLHPVGSYSKLKPCKIDPYKIVRKIGDNAYVLDLPPTIHRSLTSNVADLIEYHPPDATPTLEKSVIDKDNLLLDIADSSDMQISSNIDHHTDLQIATGLVEEDNLVAC